MNFQINFQINFQMRLKNDTGTYEFFMFSVYSMPRFRVLPSIYRYPHVSIQWGCLNVSFAMFTPLIGDCK